VVQAAIASRWHDSYFGVVVVAWAFAIALVRARRSAVQLDARHWERGVGLLVFAASITAMLMTRERYSTVHRVLPLSTGIGLAILASGVRRLPGFTRELALLAVPLVHPLPVPLYRLFEHLPQTATLSTFYLQTVGFSVERFGTILLVPGAVVEVGDGCGGIDTTSLLLALAVVVACVFRTTVLQAALLAGSAVLIAFAGNAARVACLAVIASRAPDLYEVFDGRGAGAPVFTVLIAGVALAVWWAVLRSRAGVRCSDPAPDAA
jgi:cyanoexosortase A